MLNDKNKLGGIEMITGYIYNVETMELVATLSGDQAKIEKYADDNYDDDYGLTYTPAFGCNDGLIDNGDAETIDLED